MSSNAKALLARLQQQREETAAIQAYWSDTFPTFPELPASQVRVWTNLYDFETVVYGIDVALQQQSRRAQAVAERKQGAAVMKMLDVIKYASGVMKRHEAEPGDRADDQHTTKTEGGFDVREV
jgi:hypothetical protein